MYYWERVKFNRLGSNSTREEIIEAMSVALVVGGTIVIPHLRRAVAFLDELAASAQN